MNGLRTRVMRCAVSSSNVQQCTLCAYSTHDVHHAIVAINVIIGVLVVHCELLVVRVVPIFICDDAVVRRTLVLIASTVTWVFIVAILRRSLLYWKYSVYTPRRWQQTALAVAEICNVMMLQVNSENHTSNKYPESLFNKCPWSIRAGSVFEVMLIFFFKKKKTP